MRLAIHHPGTSAERAAAVRQGCWRQAEASRQRHCGAERNKKKQGLKPCLISLEHDALITTLLSAINNPTSKRPNSRISPGMMTVNQATVKKALQACRKNERHAKWRKKSRQGGGQPVTHSA